MNAIYDKPKINAKISAAIGKKKGLLHFFGNRGFKPCALSAIPDLCTTDIVWPRKQAVIERHVGRWQNTEYCLKKSSHRNLCGPPKTSDSKNLIGECVSAYD